MSLQLTDADTPETLAGVVRLLRRAAKLAWAAVDADGTGSPRQVLALGIDLAADEARNLLPDDIGVEGPVPVGLLAHDHCPRFAHLGTRLLRADPRWSFDLRLGRNPTTRERNTIMELLMATAAEAADILGASRSWVYRLIPAKPLESIKGGRSRRISVASIHNVAAERAGAELVEASRERSGESATPGKAQEVGDVLSA